MIKKIVDKHKAKKEKKKKEKKRIIIASVGFLVILILFCVGMGSETDIDENNESSVSNESTSIENINTATVADEIAQNNAIENITKEENTIIETESNTATELLSETEMAVELSSEFEKNTESEKSTGSESFSVPEEFTQHIHTFTKATCTESAKCSCGAVGENAKGHNWQSATCTTAKKCSVCGSTEGSANGHNFSEGRCSVCGFKDPNYASEVLVWVPTKGGKKYHSHSGCSGMEDPIQETEREALSQGFGPCGRCY